MCIYIYKIVTRTLRSKQVHRTRRINKDSPSKPHSKHERREFRKMRGWTTSDVKKIKNLIKTFRLETFFSARKISSEKFIFNLVATPKGIALKHAQDPKIDPNQLPREQLSTKSTLLTRAIPLNQFWSSSNPSPFLEMIYLGIVEKKRRNYFHLLLHESKFTRRRQHNQKAFVHSTIFLN